MEQIKIYNLANKSSEKMALPANIFGVALNRDLLKQVVVSFMSRARKRYAKTKTRAERRGGGRKPWPQKGTGRARAGSIRSPLFRKGGVIFGPSPERNYKKKINKKMKEKAFLIALSSKVKDKELIIFEGLKLPKISTKNLEKELGKLKISGEKTLLVLKEKNRIIEKSARNLPYLTLKTINNINVLDILINKWLLTEKEAMDFIKKHHENK